MIKYKVTLTKAERDELEAHVSKETHPVARIKNALILLSCDEGENATKYPNKVINDVAQVNMKTIEKVKKSL